MAIAKPLAPTLGANWKASSGTALLCITGAEKEVQPVSEPNTVRFLEITTASEAGGPVEVKPEVLPALKTALEGGGKLLTLVANVYLKSGTVAHLTAHLSKAAVTYEGTTHATAFATAEWLPAPSLSAAQAEAITSVAAFEELLLVVSHVAGGAARVYEVTFSYTWTEGASTLAGSTAVRLALTGSVIGKGRLVGQAPVRIGAPGVIRAVGLVAGSSTVRVGSNASVSATGAIAGTGRIRIGSTTALTGRAGLVGTSPARLSLSGALAGFEGTTGRVAGSLSMVVNAGGRLAGHAPLTATLPIRFRVIGALGILEHLVVLPGAVAPRTQTGSVAPRYLVGRVAPRSQGGLDGT